MIRLYVFFFFQAEDGIRDYKVTGVQTCALPISPHLLRHTGRALVFDDYPSLKQAVDDPHLDVNGEDILVLRNAGPKGAAMPEWGMLPIPTRRLKQGVKQMRRLSEPRISATGDCGRP